MKRCLCLTLFLLALAVPATAGATTFGAAVGATFSQQTHRVWSQARVMRNLEALYRAGGRVARSDSDWASSEPRLHHFDWRYNDLIVTEMAQARLRWEPTLAFAPRWTQGRRSDRIDAHGHRGRAHLPPAHNGDFAYYASAFMKRYGRNGAFWKQHRKLPYRPVTAVEVWNEPDNLYDWGQHIDLGAYARMYEVVRSAVHHVDRHARVITGGLAWTESSLPRLLKAFDGKPIDAIAIHPYGVTPTETVRVARNSLAAMTLYGRGRTPVSANEYGWTSIRGTWGSTNPRHLKAYTYRALIGLSRLRLAEIIPFNWTFSSWGLNSGSFAHAVATIQRR